MKNYTSAVPVERTVSITKNAPMTPCPDCDGRGYTYSDPDGRQLVCQTCEGEEAPERDLAMERSKFEAQREDAEEGRQERIREQPEAACSQNNSLPESIFGQDDPDEACPGDRRTGREIKDIAAMILQEAGGRKHERHGDIFRGDKPLN